MYCVCIRSQFWFPIQYSLNLFRFYSIFHKDIVYDMSQNDHFSYFFVKIFFFMYMILKMKKKIIHLTILQEVIDYFKLSIILSFMALSVLLMSFLSIRENRIKLCCRKNFFNFFPLKQFSWLFFSPAKSGKLGPSCNLYLLIYIICNKFTTIFSY